MKINKLLMNALLLIAYITHINAQYEWQIQSSPVNADLVSVTFTDSIHGWIAAENGTVISTSDAGAHWQSIAQLGDVTPTDVFFHNTQVGWLTTRHNILADSAIIFKTTNGGANWQPVFHKLHFFLNSVFFADDTMGWTAGCEISESDTLSLIMHSTDGGQNWTIPQGPRIMNELYAIHFRDLNYGQACGQDGIFFSTNNGGRNEISGWAMNIAIPAYSKDLYSIFNAGDNYGCAVGEGGFVLFTTDKWANHTDYNIESNETLMAVTGLPNGTTYWAAGRNGCIVRAGYSILGLGLIEEVRITSNDLNDIHASDDHHVWAAGDKGTIVYYGKGLTISQYKLNLRINKIYPNPAREYLYVEFDDTDAGEIMIQSIEGKEYLTLMKPAGISELRINTNGFPSGIYIVKLNQEKHIMIIK